MGIFPYRGDVVAAGRIPYIYVGRRGKLIVVELRAGRRKEMMPPYSHWHTFPVIGVIFSLPSPRWPRVLRIHEARDMMYAADESVYGEEFDRITQGEFR